MVSGDSQRRSKRMSSSFRNDATLDMVVCSSAEHHFIEALKQVLSHVTNAGRQGTIGYDGPDWKGWRRSVPLPTSTA